MLSITHMAMGGMIASAFPNPVIYLPLTLGSHYLLDFIPHWDCGTGLETYTKTKSLALAQEVVDLTLSGLFLLVVFSPLNYHTQFHIWIAAITSIVPDFIEAPSNFLNWNPQILHKLNWFHQKFHSKPLNLIEGLTPQLIFLWLVYLWVG